MADDNSGKSGGQSLISVFGSVLASMFGVQSGRKHAEDFSAGKPWVYVVVGLVVTIAFILTVWFVVKMVLKSAGV
jgi:CDP-diglyceride synthetase